MMLDEIQCSFLRSDVLLCNALTTKDVFPTLIRWPYHVEEKVRSITMLKATKSACHPLVLINSLNSQSSNKLLSYKMRAIERVTKINVYQQMCTA